MRVMLAALDAGSLSLVAQLGSMAVAALVGRFVMKSRTMIWLVGFLGAFGAMCAHMAVDGQGAFLLLLYTPLIYFAAVVGRNDLPVRRGYR